MWKLRMTALLSIDVKPRVYSPVAPLPSSLAEDFSQQVEVNDVLFSEIMNSLPLSY